MAINPDIMAVQRNSHDLGHLLVDPKFHWKQALPVPAAESRMLFSSLFEKRPKVSAASVSQSGGGITYKRHVRVGGRRDARGRVLPSTTFMLKPYYETLGEWNGAYGGYPLPGWTEMAIQAMLHAGGLGHMAMKIHSHLPSSGPPVLAVELEPGMQRISDVTVDPNRFAGDQWLGDNGQHWGRVVVNDDIRKEAAKLAAFDFLVNHQDRHGGNLLFRHTKRDGKPHISELLAIDNGRAMHYSQANRFHSDWNNRGDDHLFNYMRSPGYENFKLRDPKNIKVVLDSVSDWWKHNGKKIRKEFYRQIRGIKVEPFADHIERHFNLRADALDKFVRTYATKGHKAYHNQRGDKRAYAQLSVPVGGHDPESPWESSRNSGYDSMGGDGADVCPTCGECLTCNPHTPGKQASEQ